MKRKATTLFAALGLAIATTPCWARPPESRPDQRPGPGHDSPRDYRQPAPKHDSRRDYRHPSSKHHWRPGYATHRLPGASVRILLGGIPYYYHAGVFFKIGSGGYVVVSAPLGAIVPILPFGCDITVVNGVTYYCYDGCYYRRTYGGYVVVAEPVAVVRAPNAPPTPPVPPAPEAPPSGSTQSWTVWITNPNGSKTPVEVKAADGGQWIGPRGEYYDEFPTEEQLLPVYGLGLDKPPAGDVPPAVENEKTVWITNLNGSKSKVVLTAGDDGTWIGPKGEIYDALPSEDQLRPIYGVGAPGGNAPAQTEKGK